MTSQGDTTRWDIRRTAEAYRANTVSPSAVLDQHLARIARLDSGLNAFIAVDKDGALAAGAESTKRFLSSQPLSILDGIPVALKDNIDAAGLATTNGSSASWLPAEDSVVAQRLRSAGAVIVGKLNMHEGALGATTDNPHHGQTHNPWRHGFTPGGSSGGCAAAVASGMVMAAIGTDTLGSVRIPAAYCGIVGFKPTKGLIDMSGIADLCPTLDHAGPLCRRVDDVSAVMSVLVDAPGIADRFPDDMVGEIKIGYVDPLPDGICDPAVADGYAAAVAGLSLGGAAPEAVVLDDIDFPALRRLALICIEAEAAKALADSWSRTPYIYSEAFRAMMAYGRDASPERVAAAQGALSNTAEIVNQLLSAFDLLAMPATPQAAFAFDAATPATQADFTGLANVAGCPAIVIPTGVGGDGLPTSLQLLAAPGRDAFLLAVAHRLARVWALVFPPL